MGSELTKQRYIFELAVKRSKATGKPLLIIGDPNNGIINRVIQTYGLTSNRDRILDLNPSGLYPSYDLNKTHLQEFNDNSYVIFESKTFNFSNNIVILLKNALRVSGGDLYCTGSNISNFWIKYGRHLYKLANEGFPQYALSVYIPQLHQYISIYLFEKNEWYNLDVGRL